MKPRRGGLTVFAKSGARPSLQIGSRGGRGSFANGAIRAAAGSRCGERATDRLRVSPRGVLMQAFTRYRAIAAGVGPSTMDLMQEAEYGWPCLLP
jgi:hypothetical protein